MKRFALLAILTSLTTPLLAQSTALTLFVTRQQNGGSARVPSSTFDVRAEFDDPTGFGVAVERAIGSRFSGELAIFQVSPTATLRDASGDSATLGDLSLTNVTAMGRIHLRRGAPLDVYAGAGVASVIAGTIESREFGDVRIDNELTFALGAGAIWNFTPRLGLTVDARYLPLTLHGRPRDEDAPIDIDLDPLFLSAGLRLRF